MKKETLFNLLFAIGTIAVGVLCVGTLNYIDSKPTVPDAVETILFIILAIDVICLWRVLKMVWKAIWSGVKKLFGVDKKRQEKFKHDLNEKFAAVAHVNGLREAESSNINKSGIINKIIDRIGFSEFDRKMLLSNRLHGDFLVPEDEQTKKRYLRDWVELFAVNGELSEPEYHQCCDMAAKYDCPADVIKEIMDEMGVAVASTKKPTDWLKEMETIIYDYCERAYHSKPDFPIKLGTNFKNNLNFDGIDMAEIEMLMEKKLSVKIPADHPFNHRPADDTDFTVEDLLVAFGLVEARDRYYFFGDRCSFELSKGDIKQDNVEKDGLKHTIFTESMFMLILEIRPCMPQFPSDVPVKTIKVSGFDCLAAKVGPLATDYNQYFINCRTFVVQVSFSLVSDINKICSFLNSFRLEK